MVQSTINLLLVDGQKAFRQGLAELLSEASRPPALSISAILGFAFLSSPHLTKTNTFGNLFNSARLAICSKVPLPLSLPLPSVYFLKAVVSSVLRLPLKFLLS